MGGLLDFDFIGDISLRFNTFPVEGMLTWESFEGLFLGHTLKISASSFGCSQKMFISPESLTNRADLEYTHINIPQTKSGFFF